MSSSLASVPSSKLTPAQRKNLKKKAAKERHRDATNANGALPTAAATATATATTATTTAATTTTTATATTDDDVTVEYVPEASPFDLAGADELADVFKRFAARASAADATTDASASGAATAVADAQAAADAAARNGTADGGGGAGDAGAKLTNRERKMQRIGQVGKLKQLVERPDVVEVWDATAPDPEFLVLLKAHRNSVPVPRHWNRKKRYLQGKRGVDKKPYELPEFVQATGIAKLRDAYVERESAKKMKAKGRERIQPKMGKMDINYEVLHDAFFKHQKRPAHLTAYGDLYYEGRENETKLSEARPGVLSNELRAALGIAPEHPPPWLANMQRNGPPPSYPNLRIPGLNAPIPQGAQFGYHPGGWGKPPMDEFGRPLYGDVFGTAPPVESANVALDRTHWGAINDESSESESDSDSDSDDDDDNNNNSSSNQKHAAGDDDDMDTDEMPPPPADSGFASVSSTAGTETPSVINLRKRGIETPSGLDTPADGFTILQPQRAAIGAGIVQTAHTYQLPSVAPEGAATTEPAFNLTKRSVADAKLSAPGKDKQDKKLKSTF
jgi:splicing factor 3B subunit 2